MIRIHHAKKNWERNKQFKSSQAAKMAIIANYKTAAYSQREIGEYNQLHQRWLRLLFAKMSS
ncbi:hypothetical protein [Nitrosomonas communis]|uniref:hypothetical protein n=1 Tax=Nitrosomonas communis TaxID=44574 RepID=UPI0009445535|nr:hypothetical protein [Nitrosomonas communis]